LSQDLHRRHNKEDKGKSLKNRGEEKKQVWGESRISLERGEIKFIARREKGPGKKRREGEKIKMGIRKDKTGTRVRGRGGLKNITYRVIIQFLSKGGGAYKRPHLEGKER